MVKDMNAFDGLLILGILMMGIWIGIAYRKWRRRKALSASRLQGRKGEENAEKWLSKNGFENLESQNEKAFTYAVNGKPHSFKVRPDFMARYQGERWLIEVKTGQSASVGHSATRRQLREYAQLWPQMRYGLFDATQGVLHEISFKTRSSTINRLRSPVSVFMLSLGLLIGGMIGIWIGSTLQQG